MATTDALEDVAVLARELYGERIAAQISLADRHKFLVLDVTSGDYEVDESEDDASDRIELRKPNGVFYLMRADGGPADFLGGSGYAT